MEWLKKIKNIEHPNPSYATAQPLRLKEQEPESVCLIYFLISSLKVME